MGEESLFGLSPQRLKRVLSIVTNGADNALDVNGGRCPNEMSVPAIPLASVEMLLEKPGD